MNLSVINLWEPTADCSICGKETFLNWFLPMWCEYIVPDDIDVDWAGMPVCKSCFDNPPPERFLRNPDIGIDKDVMYR